MENIWNRIGIRLRSSELVWESELELETFQIKIINRDGNSELESESELELANIQIQMTFRVRGSEFRIKIRTK